MEKNIHLTQKGKAYTVGAIVGAAISGRPLPVSENICYDLTDEQIKEALYEKSPFPDDERLFGLNVIADNADRLEVQSQLIELKNDSYLARCEAQFYAEKNRSEKLAKTRQLEAEKEKERMQKLHKFIDAQNLKGGIINEEASQS